MEAGIAKDGSNLCGMAALIDWIEPESTEERQPTPPGQALYNWESLAKQCDRYFSVFVLFPIVKIVKLGSDWRLMDSPALEFATQDLLHLHAANTLPLFYPFVSRYLLEHSVRMYAQFIYID